MKPDPLSYPARAQRRSWRAPACFFLASAAAHGAALLLAPAPQVQAPSPAAAPAMEVALRQPERPAAASRPVTTAPVARREAAAPSAAAPTVAQRRHARSRFDTPALPRSAERPKRIAPSRTASLPPTPAPAVAPADEALAAVPSTVEASSGIEAPSRPEAAPGQAPRPGVTAAAYLTSPPPAYPAASRRAGEEGTVTLRVRVGRDGSPASVAVEASSGSSRLDAAAEQAVRQWRFRPARRGAEPVESWMRVPVIFRLKDAS